MPRLTRSHAAKAVDTGRPPMAPAPRWAQVATTAALVAGAVYLVWRWGFTIDGAALWLAIPLVVAETYGLTMLALLAFSCWRLAARPTPEPLEGRQVALLIATFDEDEDVLRPTVVGALAVRNDVEPEVWVLDDGGREWVREMCMELGARYLSRPAPRTHAKAGNINHALEHVDAEFLVTLDADHVPRPELIERMLSHMADPRMAIVQAPQAFYNRGFGHPRAEDDPLRNEQSIFFDVICRGKDRHGAAFWCGCPSVIRREALVEVGGVATDTVVEDAHTSLRPQRARLAHRLPQRGDGPRHRARGDRRLRRPARSLGAGLAADAAAGHPAVQARPHDGPALGVHGQLPALPRGPAAGGRPDGSPDRAGDRHHPDLGLAAPVPADLRPSADPDPHRLEGPDARPLPSARGRALLDRAHGGLPPRARGVAPRTGRRLQGHPEGRAHRIPLARRPRAAPADPDRGHHPGGGRVPDRRSDLRPARAACRRAPRS